MDKTLIQMAIDGVVAQGALAYNSSDTCMLRTPDGLKCAVGHLIDDAHYTVSLEQLANPRKWRTCRRAIALSHPELGLDPEDPTHIIWELLADLQSAHDNAAGVLEFVEEAQAIQEGKMT